MARQLNLKSLVIFLSLLFSILAPVEPSSLARPNNSETMTYIESSCKGTLHPGLCKRCLTKFANTKIDGPQHLAHVALAVSLSRALQTRGYLLKVAKEVKALKSNKREREYLMVQDCVNQISDSVDQLSQSIKELRRLNRLSSTINDKVLWHISNIETWSSTALTDASSCVQSFPGHRMSKRVASIKVRAKNVAELTSNALALFHRYALRYQQAAARSTKKP